MPPVNRSIRHQQLPVFVSRTNANFNRRLHAPENLTSAHRERLARDVTYRGSPLHKRNPGDFGLTPPAQPRTFKSLCDVVQVFDLASADALLKEGARRGLISDRALNDWPKYIWAVRGRTVVEAILENQGNGSYHGYPLQESDPMSRVVLDAWDRNK